MNVADTCFVSAADLITANISTTDITTADNTTAADNVLASDQPIATSTQKSSNDQVFFGLVKGVFYFSDRLIFWEGGLMCFYF